MSGPSFGKIGILDLRLRHAVGSLLLLLGGVVALRLMGQVWWCREGDASPWSFDIWTPHNSQHLIDPYSVTHVLHGIALYAIVWLLFRSRLGAADRGLIAIGLEVLWEIVENTPLVIDRYRETTISLNYYGDSVVNSIGDTLSFAVGYALAATLPFWASALGFVAADALLLLLIRDSLALNVLMLLFPLDSVRDWQLRGAVTAVAASWIAPRRIRRERVGEPRADGRR